MKLYHSTYAANRASIQRHGLEARDTSKHNYRGIMGPNTGVKAVYVSRRPGYWGNEDVWEIDSKGLPYEPDPLLSPNSAFPMAYRILTDIPPERIRLMSEDELANAA